MRWARRVLDRGGSCLREGKLGSDLLSLKGMRRRGRKGARVHYRCRCCLSLLLVSLEEHRGVRRMTEGIRVRLWELCSPWTMEEGELGGGRCDERRAVASCTSKRRSSETSESTGDKTRSARHPYASGSSSPELGGTQS